VANPEIAQKYKDYAATFGPVWGKRVLDDLKAECGRIAYVPGDIWETFRRTVMRDFIAYIEDKIEAGGQQIEVEEG
jgi:hypothetical protein